MAWYDLKGNLVDTGVANYGNGNWASGAPNLTSGQTYSVGAILTTKDGAGTTTTTSVPAANRIQVKIQ